MRRLVGPRAPRMAGDIVHPQRRQLLDQRTPPGHGERGAHPDVLQLPVVVVQAQQQGADHRPALVQAVARHHTVGGAGMLDLEHGAVAGPVRQIERLGDHPVQPRPLELREPAARQLLIRRRGRRVHRCPSRAQRRDQGFPAGRLRLVHQRIGAERQQIERDQRGGRPLGEGTDPGVRRVNALQQLLEVQPAAVGDDDLAVDDAAPRQLGPGRGDHFGEVAGERFRRTAGDLDVLAVPEDDDAEAVPLGLVLHAGGDVGHQLREHGGDRGHDGQVHGPDPEG